MDVILGLFFFLIGLGIFFIPTYFAYKKNHPAKIAIILTNILAGVIYGIGWFIALIWVFNGAEKRYKPNKEKDISIYEEIEKLHKLKEKNIISEEEFSKKKNELLDL